ncbi:MAG TPA: alpha/beta fold hydrolase [Streptosporangiaceae bacterium]
MATFVIVHGAWGGGWEWSPVAGLLRRDGHRAFTPTLTGMGERAHLSPGEPVGLGTHIDDIVAVLEFERLRDVVLCGASYGGLPATGAADRAADRVRLLVYVDGLVPVPGRPAIDQFPARFASLIRDGLAEHGPAWRVPMPPGLFDALIPAGSIPDAVRQEYLSRIRAHPAATFTEPIGLTSALESVPRAFVRCTASDFAAEVGGDPVAAAAARARDAGWAYREISVGHDPQVFDAEGIARLLTGLAS